MIGSWTDIICASANVLGLFVSAVRLGCRLNTFAIRLSASVRSGPRRQLYTREVTGLLRTADILRFINVLTYLKVLRDTHLLIMLYLS